MDNPKQLTTGPRSGDVLVRGDGHGGFDLLKAVTYEPIQTNLSTVEAAIEVARARGAGMIWQQPFDNRGRALADPIRLLNLTDPHDWLPS